MQETNLDQNSITYDIRAKALAAGLTSDVLAEAAANLCKLRGSSSDDREAVSAAIDEIVKFRQIEQAIDSTSM